MRLSYESGALLAANLLVGAANIYVAPQGAIISLLFGMTLGRYQGSLAVSAALTTGSRIPQGRDEQVAGLLDAIPKFGTLLLGVSALFGTINRIGTATMLGKEVRSLSFSMILLGYYLGKSLKLFDLRNKADLLIAGGKVSQDQARLQTYVDATI